MSLQPFSHDMIQVGISSCLLGEKVRYNGGHKASRFCQHDISQHVNFIPICPEMAIGMGTPRPAIRLVKHLTGIKVQSADGTTDVTEALHNFSAEKVKTLGALSGYILCPKSPSCGMERVVEYTPSGHGKKPVSVCLHVH